MSYYFSVTSSCGTAFSVEFSHVVLSVYLSVVLLFIEITGQDVVCCGFVGAMMGGLLCASTALHRNVYEDLVKLRKENAKSK